MRQKGLVEALMKPTAQEVIEVIEKIQSEEKDVVSDQVKG